MKSKIPKLPYDRTPQWFNTNSVDDSDNDNDDLVNTSFDIALAGASTPLRIRNGDNNDNVVFLSPITKLNNLHLESKYDLARTEAHSGNRAEIKNDSEDMESADRIRINDDDNNGEEDDDDDYYEEYGFGNETIRNDTESESENDGDTSSNGGSEDYSMTNQKPPRFVNIRKRQYSDSPLDMVITPMDNNMSVCYNSSTSVFHLSISQSDSTPCPSHPRKKLKFKNNSNEVTPSQNTKQHQRKKLLDLSSSVKTSANTLINKFNNVELDHSSDNEEFQEESTPISINSTMFSSGGPPHQQSTPISQSTPSNSRAPSPRLETEEVGEGINGYKFVKPVKKSTTVYPNASRLKTQSLKDLYNIGNYNPSTLSDKYEIIRELPVTSMGMMNESDDDVHFADKRINDPYLTKVAIEKNNEETEQLSESRRIKYMEGNMLPLRICFENINVDKQEILRKINDDESILQFYNDIKLPNETLLDIIKKERVKWHPDKWITKLGTHSHFAFDKEIIDSLSQVLNSIVEELS